MNAQLNPQITAHVGLGAFDASAAASLMATAQNGCSAYSAALKSNPGGVCGTQSAAPASLASLQHALTAMSSLVVMLSPLGGYAASYSAQAQQAINTAKATPQRMSGTFDICINPAFGSAALGALGWVQNAYSSASQQIAQSMGMLPGSVTIPAGHTAQLTVAMLGWPYAGRPLAAQVQTLLAGSVHGFSGAMTVQSVTDTGKSDALGNALYTANVTASGTSVSSQSIAKAGAAAAPYKTGFCSPNFIVGSGCVGIYAFTDTTPPPVHLGPVKAQPQPAPVFFNPGGIHQPLPQSPSPTPVFHGTPAPSGGFHQPLPTGGGVTATGPAAGPASTSGMSTGEKVALGAGAAAAIGAGAWLLLRRKKR